MDLVERREDLEGRDQRPCFDVVDLQIPLLELVVDRHLDVENPHGRGFLRLVRFVGDISRRGPADDDVGPTHEYEFARLQRIDALFEAQVVLRRDSRGQLIGIAAIKRLCTSGQIAGCSSQGSMPGKGGRIG